MPALASVAAVPTERVDARKFDKTLLVISEFVSSVVELLLYVLWFCQEERRFKMKQSK